MKELSIEQKAKRYDEVLKQIKECTPDENGFVAIYPNEIFPELKKPDDEKIRKALIDGFNVMKESKNCGKTFSNHNIPVEDILAWLEKQGTKEVDPRYSILDKLIEADDIYQMSVNDAMVEEAKNKVIEVLSKLEISKLLGFENQCEQKSADKAEPKFKVGDWIVYYRNDTSREILYVYDIRDDRYYFNDNIHFSWSIKECDEKSHLWTIADAKCGDVLYMDNGLSTCTFIYKSINNAIINKYASYNNFGFESETYLVLYDGYVCPATKEQRDLLFQKMKEARYEWNAEEKELKKIDVRENLTLDGDLMEADCMIVEHNLVWSEEDERMYRGLHNLIYSTPYCDSRKELSDWLESLKNRYAWKPSDKHIH